MPLTSQRLLAVLQPVGLPPAGTCDQVRVLLPEFVTDELSGRDVDHLYPDLANHLDRCPACRQEYADLSWWLEQAFEVAHES